MSSLKLALIAAAAVAARGDIATAAPTPEALYNAGKAAFDRADYATAIVEWQASYKLSGASDLLFDIGQAYRRSGDCEHALSTYEQFIGIAATNENRPAAQELVRELEPKCGTQATAPIVDRPVAKGGRTKELAGLVTGGAGLALLRYPPPACAVA